MNRKELKDFLKDFGTYLMTFAFCVAFGAIMLFVSWIPKINHMFAKDIYKAMRGNK